MNIRTHHFSISSFFVTGWFRMFVFASIAIVRNVLILTKPLFVDFSFFFPVAIYFSVSDT